MLKKPRDVGTLDAPVAATVASGYFCPPGSIAQLDPFTGELIYVSPMACTRLGIVWPGHGRRVGHGRMKEWGIAMVFLWQIQSGVNSHGVDMLIWFYVSVWRWYVACVCVFNAHFTQSERFDRGSDAFWDRIRFTFNMHADLSSTTSLGIPSQIRFSLPTIADLSFRSDFLQMKLLDTVGILWYFS